MGFNFRAAAERYTEPEPSATEDAPASCSYCGASEFGNIEDHGRGLRATCTACGGTMTSDGMGYWQPELIGAPKNHPKMNPDPNSGGVPGVWAPVLRTEDLTDKRMHGNLITAMPGKYPAPSTMRFDTYDAPEGSEHFDEAEESHPGWSHHLLRAHDPALEPQYPADHYSAHMVGSIYYSRTPEGAEHPGVAIHDMRVMQDHRGKGYGSAMQDELRRQHPNHMIDHGARTPSGHGWAGQYRDPGDPKLDLRHPDNAGTEHHYRPTQLSRWIAEADLGHLGAVDWCRHRHAGHCWLPKNDTAGAMALYVPQDRGRCPWTTESQQQINCPVSEPGPMAGMQMRGAMYTIARFGEPTGPLLPVEHAGFKGHVEGYEGHDEEMNEQDRDFDGDFDEDLYDSTTPEPHPHEEAHHEEHGDYPDEYYERHDEAYAKAREQRAQDTRPVGHHTPLINFIHSHGQDHEFWNQHAPLTEVDHSKHSVYATQPFVVQKHLNRYMQNRSDTVHHVQEHGNSADAQQYHGTHHPMMVKHENNLYAIEGHHRTASDILSGRSTHAYLYDADKHGFPDPPEDDHYEVEHHGLQKYSKKVARCDYSHLSGKKAREHAVRHHDDGVCAATEARSERRNRKRATMTELGFHMTATWADVRNKAKRIRSEGGVNVLVASHEGVGGNVRGDTEIYETVLNYLPGTSKVAYWTCGCAWASYAWGRSAPYRRFEGRMCSHALAMQFEAQARGMFGKTVEPDTQRPGWLRERDPVQTHFDRDIGSGRKRRAVPPGNMRTTFEGSLHPYADDHALDLRHPPVYAFVVEALSQGAGPADAMKALLAAGMPHDASLGVLRDAMADPAAITATAASEAEHRCSFCGAWIDGHAKKCPHCGHEQENRHQGAVQGPRHEARCPDCGQEVPSTVDRCPHCGAHLNEGDTGDLHLGTKKEPEDDGPTHAGLVLKAGDTGRILMLQRSMEDENDPARGRWEFPGGGIEPGDHSSYHGAMREFAEEVGQPVPSGGTLQHVWRSGPYQGHVLVIPHEHQISLADGRVVTNPDDPDGDHPEQAAWHEVDHARKHPGLREECKAAPWKEIKAASRGKTADFSAHDPLGDFVADPPAQRPDPKPGNQENPGSTGFATAADPPAFDAADSRSMRMPEMSSFGAAEELPGRMSIAQAAQHYLRTGELHDPEAGALPTTTGDEDLGWSTNVDPAHQHIDVGDTLERPDPRGDMRSGIDPLEEGAMQPNQVHASAGSPSVEEIVARFQASKGGMALMSNSNPQASAGPTDAQIAEAARAHVAKTALKDFKPWEQAELIGEGAGGERARNFDDLKIEGTHYEALQHALDHHEQMTDVDALFI